MIGDTPLLDSVFHSLQRIGDQTTPVTVRRVLKEASSLLSEAMGGPLVS